MSNDKMFDQKIFIIDDDPFTTALYEQSLANLGYTDVSSYNEGLLSLNDLIQEPKIIFLDQNMDDITGLEMLRKIKRFDPNIYVVMVSGQEDIETAVKALKIGAFDYIVKGEGDIEKINQVLLKISNVQEMLKRSNKGPIRKFLSFVV